MARRKALAWSPVRDLMKNVGVEVINRDAIDLVIKNLVKYAEDTTTCALKHARHDKRIKLTKDDIKLCLKDV